MVKAEIEREHSVGRSSGVFAAISVGARKIILSVPWRCLLPSRKAVVPSWLSVGGVKALAGEANQAAGR